MGSALDQARPRHRHRCRQWSCCFEVLNY
jgi:hypothetical protein